MSIINFNSSEKPNFFTEGNLTVKQSPVPEDNNSLYTTYQNEIVNWGGYIDADDTSWVDLTTNYNKNNNFQFRQDLVIAPNIGEKGIIELSSNVMNFTLLCNDEDISKNHDNNKKYIIDGKDTSKIVCRIDIQNTINKIEDGEISGDQRSAIINAYFIVPDDATDGTRSTRQLYNLLDVNNKIEQKPGENYHRTYDNIYLTFMENADNNWNDYYTVNSLNFDYSPIHEFNIISLPSNKGEITGKLTYLLTRHELGGEEDNLQLSIYIEPPRIEDAKERKFIVDINHEFGYIDSTRGLPEFDIISTIKNYEIKIDNQSLPIEIIQTVDKIDELEFDLETNYPYDFEYEFNESTFRYNCQFNPLYWKTKINTVGNIILEPSDNTSIRLFLPVSMAQKPNYTEDYYMQVICTNYDYIIGTEEKGNNKFKQIIRNSLKGNNNWHDCNWEILNERNFSNNSESSENTFKIKQGANGGDRFILTIEGDANYVEELVVNNSNFGTTILGHEYASKEYVFLKNIRDWVSFEVNNDTNRYIMFDAKVTVIDEEGNSIIREYKDIRSIGGGGSSEGGPTYIINEDVKFEISNSMWEARYESDKIIIIPPYPSNEICLNGSTCTINIIYDVEYRGRDDVSIDKKFKNYQRKIEKSFNFTLEKGMFTPSLQDFDIKTNW
ncbi:MAG: hypothetical protein J1F35_03655 [Erysipelotrichales bacterium]|nr:hypothetical protein [Erysipelotrichales bacterium]